MVDIIALRGGLGNQLFGWALGQQLAASGRTVWYDTSVLSGARTLDLGPLLVGHKLVQFGPRVWRRLSSGAAEREWVGKRCVVEAGGRFDDRVLRPAASLRFIFGYWQSWRYFDDCASLIESRLTAWLSELYSPPAYGDDNFVAVHVRRGDYVTDPAANAALGTLDISYQRAAVDFLAASGDARFKVFTDDREWSVARFADDDRVVVAPPATTAAHDLAGLASGNKLVCANSSFSWWAGWLVWRRGGTVIVPRNWFNDPSLHNADMVPDAWIRL